jgi:uncharacterized protein (TIGR02594 family)
MISRRSALVGFAATTILFGGKTEAQNDEAFSHDVSYPPFGALNDPVKYGYTPPTDKQRERAGEIIAQSPATGSPLEIAQSFVDRYYVSEPDSISQWPVPRPWNPLIVEFFRATDYPANNDMIPWCAAFVNWCLERAGKDGSGKASSQSFITKHFALTNRGQSGDVAVFTCYDKNNHSASGLGHVCFLKKILSNERINVVGGNQKSFNKNNSKTYFSIISEAVYPTTGFDVVRRNTQNEQVIFTLKLNTYVRIV